MVVVRGGGIDVKQRETEGRTTTKFGLLIRGEPQPSQREKDVVVKKEKIILRRRKYEWREEERYR